jgi:hypothetical protein
MHTEVDPRETVDGYVISPREVSDLQALAKRAAGTRETFAYDSATRNAEVIFSPPPALWCALKDRTRRERPREHRPRSRRHQASRSRTRQASRDGPDDDPAPGRAGLPELRSASRSELEPEGVESGHNEKRPGSAENAPGPAPGGES